MQLKFLCEVVLEQCGSGLSSVSDQNTDVWTRSCWLLFKLRASPTLPTNDWAVCYHGNSDANELSEQDVTDGEVLFDPLAECHCVTVTVWSLSWN